MKKIGGGVLAAKGFKAGAAAGGIKAEGLDVGLLWSETPAISSAIFTENSIQAAPVVLSRARCRDHKARAVVVNSGNANCMTGAKGRDHAERMVQDTARLLGADPADVLVASTGIIGRPLPISKVEKGIQGAFKAGSASSSTSASNTSAADFARAIMTTDTVPKSVAYECRIAGQPVVIGGCAKGSGMIQPNMATMLGFLTSDAVISPALLDEALREAARTTFNAITIDGCTSTNDMLLLMANGQAKNPAITQHGKEYDTFLETLRQACRDLALLIVRDGEGASVLVTVQINGAADYEQAKTVAYAVANSPLVKTAAHGKTGNWGRIAQAVGSTGVSVTEDSLAIDVTNPARDELDISINLSLGSADAVVYTCDFSKEYVDINVEYN